MPKLKSAKRALPISPLSDQLDRIETGVNKLLERTTIDTSELVHVSPSDTVAPLPGQVANNVSSMERLLIALRAENKIASIKEVRAMLGIGLKEALDLVSNNYYS